MVIETKQTPYPSLRHSLFFSSTKSETSGILSGVPDADSESNPSAVDGFEARLLKASTRLWINLVPGLELETAAGGWYCPCDAASNAAPWSWAGGTLGPNPCMKTCVDGPCLQRGFNFIVAFESDVSLDLPRGKFQSFNSNVVFLFDSN